MEKRGSNIFLDEMLLPSPVSLSSSKIRGKSTNYRWRSAFLSFRNWLDKIDLFQIATSWGFIVALGIDSGQIIFMASSPHRRTRSRPRADGGQIIQGNFQTTSYLTSFLILLHIAPRVACRSARQSVRHSRWPNTPFPAPLTCLQFSHLSSITFPHLQNQFLRLRKQY